MTDKIDIGVLGAEGRMGQAIIDVLADTPNAELCVALTVPDSVNLGGLIPGTDVALSSDVRAALSLCDVLIDFSSPAAAIDAALAMHGTRCHTFVTGTTGYSPTEEAALVAAGDNITLLKSGNFSLGVNMLEALVELASARLGDDWDIEILEMHHKHKVDAPSGTALMLGHAAAKGRGVDLNDKQVFVRTSHKNARKSGEIGFAAVRGGGVVGDHDVLLASDLEMITLGHRAFDRTVFAKGAVTAALWAAGKSKGVYTMRDVLGV